MHQAQSIQARLREASALPGTLTAAFDAFEAIRLLARGCTDRVPELFAAFMTTGDAAVEGREAVTVAPSLPPGPAGVPPSLAAASASTGDAIAVLAAIGALLETRLIRAAVAATDRGDRVACEEAAAAARRVHQLMARGDDDTAVR